MAAAKTTTNHAEIRKWVESRGGRPARVKRTARSGDAGILRIDYPGFSGEETLETISWDQWFDAFEENRLAFLYQDGRGTSRFSKLVARTGAGRGTSRTGAAKRTTAKRTGAKRSTAKRRTKSGAARRTGIAKRVGAKRAGAKRAGAKRAGVAAKRTGITAKRTGVERTARATRATRATRRTTRSTAGRIARKPATRRATRGSRK